MLIGPLHDPVTWYVINYTGTQITQWDFQNKGKSGWTGTSSFVLKVPLRNLRPSVIYSVPCDRIVQRAYYSAAIYSLRVKHCCVMSFICCFFCLLCCCVETSCDLRRHHIFIYAQLQCEILVHITSFKCPIREGVYKF